MKMIDRRRQRKTSRKYTAQGGTCQTRVSVPQLFEVLCGTRCHEHVEGVVTVVNKLFNMVQPDMAVFGQKDYQQLAIIRAMVNDLGMPIQIVVEPPVRATNGLALSSRSGYLTKKQRAIAPMLYRSLSQIAAAIRGGDHDFAKLRAERIQHLEAAGLRMDYLEVRQGVHLKPAIAEDRNVVLLVAAYLGATRLIDNLRLNLA